MKRISLLLFTTVLVGVSIASQAEIIEVPDECIALYQQNEAIAYTEQCEINAAAASTNLRNFRCTARPEWIDAYCNLLGRYDDDPDDGVTQYGSDNASPGADTTDDGRYCEGVAGGEYIPTVPQPIDAYVGLASTGYTVYSTTISVVNLSESRQQAIETGDSSEFFSNVYGLLWSIVAPLGDVLGMDDVFEDFSQLADDLATGGSC